MVKIMENPIKMDNLGVPLFLETPIYVYIYIYDFFVYPSTEKKTESLHVLFRHEIRL